jgi:hypothetical protein
VVKLNLANRNVTFSIFPNPIKGKQFNVQLEGLEKGDYSIKLINQSGSEVYSKLLKVAGGSFIEQVNLKQQLAAGMYTLVIRNGYIIVGQQQVAIE